MLLTVQQLANQLHIKPSTLYAWASQGKIPCLKLHGLLRFRCEDIERWIDSCEMAAEPVIKRPTHRRALSPDVETLIARAKDPAYNSRPRGNQTEIKPHRKGGA